MRPSALDMAQVGPSESVDHILLQWHWFLIGYHQSFLIFFCEVTDVPVMDFW